ncbi:MAG: hypothetical protein BroJett025_09060 [Patescibacteria group bacterium]|nr:MAG: hypothetical protein BroJett025_09060 [Patescibacteria group bacterium]
MQSKYAIIGVLVLGAVFLGYSALRQPKQETAPEQLKDVQVEQATTQEVPANGDESVMEKVVEEATSEGQLIAMIADDFSFDVKEIRVKQGEKLTVSVTNEKGFHDFVIDELAVNSGMIPAGETMELEIPTDKPGTYEYYCSVGQHRQMGMKGTLIVE